MRSGGINGRRQCGLVLSLLGVLIVFLCLPVEFFLIVLGVLMTACGLYLLVY